LACDVAFGSSSLTAWVRRGAVTIKITSSTSITSISGTMLISAIGAASSSGRSWRRPSCAPQAAAGRAAIGRTFGPGSAPTPVPSGWPIETKVCSS
jgi:hypothetical protein